MAAYLVQGQANGPSLLNHVIIDDDGFLVDPVEIGARVFGPDNVQVYPVAPTFADVLTTGKISLGFFYLPYTFDAAAAKGLWKIEWRWKLATTETVYRTWELLFYVEQSYDLTDDDGFRGLPFRSIVAPAEMRSLGLTVTQASDVRLERLIREAIDYIEKETRNWFRPVYFKSRVDGGHANTLMLPMGILGIEDVWINESTSAQNHSSYRPNFYRIDKVDPAVQRPDPRYNPHLTVRRSASIFQGNYGSYGNSVYGAGITNVQVAGIFGYLEGDGKVPAMLMRAAFKLVYSTAVSGSVTSSSSSVPAGQLTSRTVDFYSESYAQTGGSATTLTSVLARSPEVEQILKAHRAPLALGAPMLSSEMYDWSW